MGLFASPSLTRRVLIGALLFVARFGVEPVMPCGQFWMGNRANAFDVAHLDKAASFMGLFASPSLTRRVLIGALVSWRGAFRGRASYALRAILNGNRG